MKIDYEKSDIILEGNENDLFKQFSEIVNPIISNPSNHFNFLLMLFATLYPNQKAMRGLMKIILHAEKRPNFSKTELEVRKN